LAYRDAPIPSEVGMLFDNIIYRHGVRRLVLCVCIEGFAHQNIANSKDTTYRNLCETENKP